MRHYLIINGCLRPNNTVSDTNNNWKIGIGRLGSGRSNLFIINRITTSIALEITLRDDIWPQKSRLSKFLLLLPITYFLVEAGERSR